MTTQAMALSLEQQAKQRQSQPLEHHAQAQAPGAASLTPPPAVTPKPKKTPTPEKEPERDLELVGACLRVRSRGQAGGRAGVGQQAPRPQKWETRGGGGAQEDAEKMPPGPSPTDPSGFALRVAACPAGLLLLFPFLPQETSQEAEVRPRHPKSFRQKRDYFQNLGEGPWGGNPTQKLSHRPSLARGRWGALYSSRSVWPVQEPRWVGQVESNREGHLGHLQGSRRSR